jgi:hypothetical protein
MRGMRAMRQSGRAMPMPGHWPGTFDEAVVAVDQFDGFNLIGGQTHAQRTGILDHSRAIKALDDGRAASGQGPGNQHSRWRGLALSRHPQDSRVLQQRGRVVL